MTPEKLLELLESYGFHIEDGLGDICSGCDKEEMLQAAKEILDELRKEKDTL